MAEYLNLEEMNSRVLALGREQAVDDVAYACVCSRQLNSSDLQHFLLFFPQLRM